MLVLTRKMHEQIMIGQDITVTIVRVRGNTVRIGIEAPRQVRVVRGELPRHDADTPGVRALAVTVGAA
jgi:carbon storage regulator CsrA